MQNEIKLPSNALMYYSFHYHRNSTAPNRNGPKKPPTNISKKMSAIITKLSPEKINGKLQDFASQAEPSVPTAQSHNKAKPYLYLTS